jgi:ceramide glucosyltransferase
LQSPFSGTEDDADNFYRCRTEKSSRNAAINTNKKVFNPKKENHMELFYILAALSIIGLAAYFLQIWAVYSYMPAKSPPAGSPVCPPVSILKPLKGLDDNLYDNLESLCCLNYPTFEVIFSLQTWNDPAYKVAKMVKDKYPDVDITIHIERCNRGLNPKINNLIPAYRISKYDHILISDSNVMIDSDYLKEITSHLQDPNVGLVSNLIRGMGGKSYGAIFENLHLNSFVIGSVSFLDKFLRMPCVVGKSMLMKKKDLESIGGFEAMKDVLAEDYLIGKRLHEMGKKVVVSGHMINNVNEHWGIRRFLNRHTRWAKIRWQVGGVKYMSELPGNPVFMAILPLLLVGFSAMTLEFAGAVSILKAAGDFMMGRRIGSDLKISSYLLGPLKDILIGAIWIVPIFSNTVVWRGNRYLIGRDSFLSPCPESGLLSMRYRLFDTIKARLA